MERASFERIQSKMERVTRKWWFLALFILIATAAPPIVTKGFEPSKTGEIIGYLLSNALIEHISPLYPLFKVIPLLLVLALILYGNRVGKVFSVYAGISYLLFAVFQSISITEKYGFGLVTSNFILMIVVAGFWLWEAFVGKNNFSPRRLPFARYWVIPLAVLAFWYPINLESMQPDFNPVYFFTNSAGLAFCCMTPVYLAILILYFPQVNIATLRVTSLLGTIIGFWNLVINFGLNPELLWWNGVLHLPLDLYPFTL